MAGPGGREVGRVAVRVVPDTSQFARKLKGDLEALEKRLEVKIPTSFDVQTKGLNQRVKAATVAAQAAAKDIELQVDIDRNQVERAAASAGSQAGSSFNRGFSRSVRPRTALIASLIAAIALASPQLLVLAGSLAQVAGVAALIPGLFGGVAAAAAVAVIGIAGLGSAFTKLSASQAEFEKSIRGVPPAVQKTARALRSMRQALDGVQAAVSRQLFEQMAAPLRDMAEHLIPQLRRGLIAVADGLGDFVRSIVTELAAVGRSSDLTDFLNNVALALKNLTGFGRSAVRILNDLGVVGGRFLPDLASSLSDAAERFANFIAEARKSGDLEQFISDGISVIAELGEVAKNTLRFINGIINAAEAAGGGTLGAFSDALKKMADVVNSPAFQAGLTDFFRGINLGLGGLASGFPALGDAIAEIAPILSDLLADLGPVLGETLRELAPALPPLVDGLAQLLVAVAPLLPMVAELVAELAPLAGFLLQAATAVASIFVPLITGALDAFRELATNAGNATSAFDVFLALVSVLLGPFSILNPLLVKLGDAVRQLGPAFTSAREAVLSALTSILSIVQSVLGLVVGIVTALVGQIRSIFAFQFASISAVVRTAVSAVLAAIQLLASLPGMVAGYMGRLVGAVLDGMARARAAAAGGIERILGLFSGLGGRLFQSGLSLIRGFANGITAGIGAAVSAASRALEAVRNLFPFSPAKEGPFSGKGWTLYSGQAIAEGLAEGMAQRTGLVRSAASSLLSGAAGELAFGSASFGGDVRVFIGDTELTDIVDYRVEESNREIKRQATAGTGRAR